MAWGMTYAEYWHGDTLMHKAFREKAKIETERDNYNAWLAGAYIYNAINVAIVNNFGKKRTQLRHYMSPLEIVPRKKKKPENEIISEYKRQAEALRAIAKKNNSQRKKQSGKREP